MGVSRFFFFAMLVFFLGCGSSNVLVMDAAEPPENKGLDTIPHYPRSSFLFSTEMAIKRFEEREERAKARTERLKREVVEMQARAAEEGAGGKFDPWIPPFPVDPMALPRAIRGLPKDYFGYVDWSASVTRKFIKPRGTILGGKEETGVLDLDILFKINDPMMANVLFSHRIHTSWLSCNNCHPSIFKQRKGANDFSMYDIWDGDYCGRCHGKVAFQPKGYENCQRCHSVLQSEGFGR